MKSTSSESSKISTASILQLLDNMKTKQHRSSTSDVYYNVWTNFNKFLVRLDNIPHDWEAKTALYCGYLVKKGAQSSTIKSYISAIKATPGTH